LLETDYKSDMKTSRYILEWSLFPDMFALIIALQIIIIIKNTILKKHADIADFKILSKKEESLTFWAYCEGPPYNQLTRRTRKATLMIQH
jgi:hypothetical protein